VPADLRQNDATGLFCQITTGICGRNFDAATRIEAVLRATSRSRSQTFACTTNVDAGTGFSKILSPRQPGGR
jgi:hypothetical protein